MAVVPVLIFLAKALVSTGIFVAAERVFSDLFDKDEQTVTDELSAVLVSAGVMSAAQVRISLGAAKTLPLPVNKSSPAAVADYFEQLANNKKGLAELNARLGGFAPLAIKATKTFAGLLRKRTIVIGAGVAALMAFINWLIWFPNLVQQYMDQGTFAPEQANAIMESWGLPFRWPVSETRKTQTDLEAQKLEYYKGLADGTGAGGALAAAMLPRTRITMTKTSEPKIAVGTLFQSVLKDTDAFKRHTDDAITSADDLKTDVQLNLNAWVASLPGRLHYEIRIVLNPLDHLGIKRQGTWAMLMIGHRNTQGLYQPMDAVALGPLEPTVYRPTMKEVETIQLDIPQILTSEEVVNLDLPSYGLRTVDGRGNVTPLEFGSATGAASTSVAGLPPNAAAPVAPSYVEGEFYPGLGTALPGGVFRPVGEPVRERFMEGVTSVKDSSGEYTDVHGGVVGHYYVVNGATGNVDYYGPVSKATTDFQAMQRNNPRLYLVRGKGETAAMLVAAPPPPAPKFPYVRYIGSPNVFDRLTGRHITEAEAVTGQIFERGLVEQFTSPRPEVKVVTDYAVWNDKNLTVFPV